MTASEKIDKQYQENLERIQGFMLMNDIFFSKCFENNPQGVELLLRIILDKPDLKVEDSRTQWFINNLLNRSVYLDVVATDDQNITYNIEVQRTDSGAVARRARYHSSIMDTNLLQKNNDFNKLPETYVIFICEHDVLGEGKALYPIERCILGSNKLFNDGAHILYVNATYRDDSPLGKLMQDFYCTDPSQMYYELLADRVKYFKQNKEGIQVMCDAMEELIKKRNKENMLETASRLLDEGNISIDVIARCCDLSIEEVEALKTQKAS